MKMKNYSTYESTCLHFDCIFPALPAVDVKVWGCTLFASTATITTDIHQIRSSKEMNAGYVGFD